MNCIVTRNKELVYSIIPGGGYWSKDTGSGRQARTGGKGRNGGDVRKP